MPDSAPCTNCGQLIRLPHRPGSRCPVCLYEFGSAWKKRNMPAGKALSDLLDVLDGGNEPPDQELSESDDFSLPRGPSVDRRRQAEKKTTDVEDATAVVEESSPSGSSWADVVFASAAELRRCGEIALEARNFQVAIEMLVEAMKEDPTSYTGWLHLGLAYAMKKRKPEALAALERARALEPDSPEVLKLSKILSR